MHPTWVHSAPPWGLQSWQAEALAYCCRRRVGAGGQRENGHIPGLRGVPGMGGQVRVLGFAQERIREQDIVK